MEGEEGPPGAYIEGVRVHVRVGVLVLVFRRVSMWWRVRMKKHVYARAFLFFHPQTTNRKHHQKAHAHAQAHTHTHETHVREQKSLKADLETEKKEEKRRVTYERIDVIRRAHVRMYICRYNRAVAIIARRDRYYTVEIFQRSEKTSLQIRTLSRKNAS